MPGNRRPSILPAARLWALLALAALGIPAAAAGTVYKCPSPQGEVTYSDQPCPGGEKMEIYLPPPAEAPAPGETAETGGGTRPGAPPFAGYSDVSIVSPGSEEEARDDSGAGSVPVALAISPALRLDLGHAIAAYVDGAPWPTRFRGPQFTLTGLDPGSHTLRAAVTDAGGRQLAASGTITFYLVRSTIQPDCGAAYRPPCPPPDEDRPQPKPGGELLYPRPGGDPPYPRPMPPPPRPTPR